MAETLPAPFRNVSLMRSTFQPRASGLPHVITYGADQTEVSTINLHGPFCAHCGNPLMYHSTPSQRCPAAQLFGLLPQPECGCHGTREQARQDLTPEGYQRALAASNTRARRDARK